MHIEITNDSPFLTSINDPNGDPIAVVRPEETTSFEVGADVMDRIMGQLVELENKTHEGVHAISIKVTE